VLAGILIGSNSSDSPFFWMVSLLAGFILGVFFFCKGFRMLRYKRLILDTPLAKIHSAAIGLVEVTGTPVGPKTLAAPVTGDPCFYYRVQAWQWTETQSGKGHEWKSVLDESSYVPFFLEDATGRMLIDSQGAEMDVHRDFSDEIEASFFNARDLVPPNIRNFLALRGLVPYEKIKVVEHIIQPAFPLFVFGTLGENTAKDSWMPRPHLSGAFSNLNIKLNAGPGLSIGFINANNSPRPLHLAPANSVTAATGTHTQYAPVPAGVTHATVSDISSAPMRRPIVIASTTHPSAHSAAITADSSGHGTDVDSSFDLHPSAAISKGERGQPFTISCQSQKEVVQALAWKSMLCIWGGPVLAILSFYILILYWQSRAL
jgi:hypothetical protein